MSRFLCVAMVLFVLSSCSGPASDLSVVSKSLHRDVNASMAGGMGDVPSNGAIFWVEGQVKNSGAEDIANVSIAFRVTDGRSRQVLTAEIPVVKAGATVDFKTPVQGSQVELRLAEDEPEITVAR
ncbi:MAG TPA: FxLYD domain-containing protein [Bacteroidota bacterium]|nr:FxLYD domain-containing protein [Bacteroidota bacterium]